MSRTSLAASRAPAIAMIVIARATGGDAAMRATNSRHGAVPCSRASSGVRRIAVTGRVSAQEEAGDRPAPGERARLLVGSARGGRAAATPPGASCAARRRLLARLAHLAAEQPRHRRARSAPGRA